MTEPNNFIMTVIIRELVLRILMKFELQIYIKIDWQSYFFKLYEYNT
jgi:hypothetical protein